VPSGKEGCADRGAIDPLFARSRSRVLARTLLAIVPKR
jgi:hypothetical protein